MLTSFKAFFFLENYGHWPFSFHKSVCTRTPNQELQWPSGFGCQKLVPILVLMLEIFPTYEQTPTTESSVCSLKVRFAVTHQMTAIFTPNISFSSAVIFLLFPHFYKMAKKWSMQMTLQRQVTAMPKPSCCLLSPHVFPLYHAELGGLNKWIPNEQKCRICGKGM